MTLEKQLISKSYYKTFMEGNENTQPIKALGEIYYIEQQNEAIDLSHIRFAQGEIYYLNKDFEAAIFKWKNILNDELKPWAQMNLADAHYELNQLAIAEGIYKEIDTDSDVLKTEVLLQLFSLYIQFEDLEMAADSIKKAVDLNPDYPDVTDMARTFFEDNHDFKNAVELAVNEAVRTESLSWFGFLEAYVKEGHTVVVEPNYFSEALLALYHIDLVHFERLTITFWNSYKQNDLYFSWLKEINHLLLNIEQERSYTWKNLSLKYNETYFELINGQYLITEFSYIIPNHLVNWMKLATDSDVLISSSAILAWNEIFPSSIEASVVNQAEGLLNQSPKKSDMLELVLGLFKSIGKWAEVNEIALSERLEWMIQEVVDFDSYHLLISGTAMNGKSAFVNTLLNEQLLEDSTSATILFKDADEAEIHAVTDDKVTNITDFDQFKNSTKDAHTYIRCKMPITFLHENKLALIDTPDLANHGKIRNDVFEYLHLADSMLFVLNANSILTGKELDIAIRIKEQLPDLPIDFLLSKMDLQANSQEALELVEQTKVRIKTYFKEAKVFSFSEYYESDSLLNELSTFIKSKNQYDLEETRMNSILYYIKESIDFLLGKRVEMENSFIDTIKWDEDILTKLKGTINQLSDMEETQVRIIKNSFGKIKDQIAEELRQEIPELLRNCSELVTEESEFGKIHIELNDEMNKRMNDYLQNTVLPSFREKIQQWIEQSEAEFQESQTYLDEMSVSFNHLYGEEKIALEYDDKVLDDWGRDADRLTRRTIQLEKVNILMRSTPSQLLLKSAGKLFGAIPQNKEMLHNKYKQLIESKDYSGIAESITKQFMQQFEIFETSLEWDISMFYKNPYEVLNRTLEETHVEIEENKKLLSNMRENPEIHRDPITLFKLKLHQYEWMAAEGEKLHQYR
ncbi:dynamin family protein [Aquibacillus rhizosphaerae]|uniref:Dynamin family protein n=1 Tax=Aquibacillus rhizosphaerae TaxID=3051431 RepID=A0ABT7L973_9BACI|nr:dynamin family protein [Aquibacillus sp. LR5S19]MDL4841777.1 dynamin family protein [Aquibacillus sp. LR5S19]